MRIGAASHDREETTREKTFPIPRRLAAPGRGHPRRPAAAQSVWRVDAGAPPGGNGASWATAFDSLDDALLAAGVDDQIWVAAGVYRPSVEVHPGDPRSAAFAVQAVGLYGGFDGTETSLDERAGLFDQTRLSGDLGAPGDPADNAYHVLFVNNPSGIPAGSPKCVKHHVVGIFDHVRQPFPAPSGGSQL